MRKWGLKAALVSVSGGIDSAVTLALMKRASQMPNSPIERLLAVAQPIHSSAWALNRAKEVATSCDVPLVVVDQTKLHTHLTYRLNHPVSAAAAGAGVRDSDLALGVCVAWRGVRVCCDVTV
jgi:NH3-dependent NAD+ synthetase